jgi:hypothetical protein
MKIQVDERIREQVNDSVKPCMGEMCITGGEAQRNQLAYTTEYQWNDRGMTDGESNVDPVRTRFYLVRIILAGSTCAVKRIKKITNISSIG